MNVWAFNQVEDAATRRAVYESFKQGRSRFGWSSRDENNLKLKDNWSPEHSQQLFLLEVAECDWIVHINTPDWGRCIAGRVKSSYAFDDGLTVNGGVDFRHCFEIDVETIVEFDRTDPNILPTVNLKPGRRYHRVYAVGDFLQSIDNLTHSSVVLRHEETKEEFHMKDKAEGYLEDITALIHEMHRKKRLERFLAKVFRRVPGVVYVEENGFGWGTDNGADLIVKTCHSIGHLDFEQTIVVQVKSFAGDHTDLEAVDQIRTAIQKYDPEAGMIVTTGRSTEVLEKAIETASRELDCEIDLLAGKEVARFVMKYAGDLVFRLDKTA